MGAVSRLKQAWNAFTGNDNYKEPSYESAPSYGQFRPDRTRLRFANERSIITAILTRIAVDVSGVTLRHVELDEGERFVDNKDSHLNAALNLEANLDQSPRAFRQDMVMSLFDQGHMAIVPVDVLKDENGGIIDILTLRVGQILAWKAQHVRVSVYNENKGVREELWLEKSYVAIIENPFFAVMNQQNSTLQRLIHKLNLLDTLDEKQSSGKLDLIIQLPYTIKTDVKRAEADRRRDDIEQQLTGSKYGIAYADSTEKIVQLNRPIENTMLEQVKFLTDMLYGQMGVTAEVMNGTANEATMLNYFDRTVEPVIDAIREGMRRTFIGDKKKETISYFRNPFRLVPLGQIADIVDKLARNEVMSSNEIRGYLGMPPSTDPKADELQNSNMPQPPAAGPPVQPLEDGPEAQLPEEEGQYEL